jgi:hypothetical protein
LEDVVTLTVVTVATSALTTFAVPPAVCVFTECWVVMAVTGASDVIAYSIANPVVVVEQ